MDFIDIYKISPHILMEGALGERLKHEYCISFDDNIALAGLVYSKKGRNALEALWCEYMSIAREYNLPFIATTPTRRANRERTGISAYGDSIIADNVSFLRDVMKRNGTNRMYAGGLIGCKGDAYLGTESLNEAEAEEFHSWAVARFAASGVDFIYAGIMPVLTEIAGMSKVIERTGLPYIISFMLRPDGRLIDGTTLSGAIDYIDSITGYHPVCYMTNCVHPRNLKKALLREFNQTDSVRNRFCGIQANASPESAENLDGSAELFSSDPGSLAEEILDLRDSILLKIVGGCCGTDNRHIREIAKRL